MVTSCFKDVELRTGDEWINGTVDFLSCLTCPMLPKYLSNSPSLRLNSCGFKLFLSASATIALNLGFPEAAKWITSTEAHPTESHLQISLYFKIAAFRWSNTAIVITFISPFTRTLSDQGLIPQIYAIFFAEIVTTNVIQMADVWGHFQRHFLAPRASSQDQMNLYFQGLEVELAERCVFVYADLLAAAVVG
jgi:hypothetical protein